VLNSQDITSIKEVGLNVFGNCLEQRKKISIISFKIDQTVYIFDFIEIMKEAADASNFIRLIGDYLTNESIVKIFYNCKFITDLFLLEFNIKIVNIFDLDVS
jgi:ribonuclease D